MTESQALIVWPVIETDTCGESDVVIIAGSREVAEKYVEKNGNKDYGYSIRPVPVIYALPE